MWLLCAVLPRGSHIYFGENKYSFTAISVAVPAADVCFN